MRLELKRRTHQGSRICQRQPKKSSYWRLTLFLIGDLVKLQLEAQLLTPI